MEMQSKIACIIVAKCRYKDALIKTQSLKLKGHLSAYTKKKSVQKKEKKIIFGMNFPFKLGIQYGLNMDTKLNGFKILTSLQDAKEKNIILKNPWYCLSIFDL